MAEFTFTKPTGETYVITAPNEQRAIAAWNQMQGENKQLPTGQQRPVQATTSPQQQNSFVDKLGTYVRGVTEGIPIAGPLAQRATDFAVTNIQGLVSGQDPQVLQSEIDARRAAQDAANPAQKIGGNLLGGLASMGGIGLTPLGANALGMTGPWWQRIANSALSGAGIAGGDELARGTSPSEIAKDMVIGGAVSGAIPLAGIGFRAAGKSVSNIARPFIKAGVNPQQEAPRRVAEAVIADMKNTAVPVMNSTDEAVAKTNMQPIMNVDRGGENLRSLARSAANMSPDAKAIITKTADERFVTQSARTQDMLRRVSGKDVDANLVENTRINLLAKQSISPEYQRVFNLPKSQAVFTPELAAMIQRPSIQRAIGEVGKRSAERATIGVKPITNPFVKDANGEWVIAVQPDGSRAIPRLEFWDQVKQNLDGYIEGATSGMHRNKNLAIDLQATKRMLVENLDNMVPEYAAVRGERFKLFQAEDAVQAGENFASPGARIKIPEAKQAFTAMTDAEKEGFRIGFVSLMMRRFNTANDRVNLMRQFKVPAFREQIQMVLGPAKSAEIEAFVRVEDIIDQVRGALGNSSTAMQFASMGALSLGGAGGSFVLGADPVKGAGIGMLLASGRVGARALSRKVDERVLKSIAELLASDDPTLINRAIANAMMSKPYMNALEAIQNGLGITSRASLQSVALN